MGFFHLIIKRLTLAWTSSWWQHVCFHRAVEGKQDQKGPQAYQVNWWVTFPISMCLLPAKQIWFLKQERIEKPICKRSCNQLCIFTVIWICKTINTEFQIVSMVSSKSILISVVWMCLKTQRGMKCYIWRLPLGVEESWDWMMAFAPCVAPVYTAGEATACRQDFGWKSSFTVAE